MALLLMQYARTTNARADRFRRTPSKENKKKN